MLLGLLRRSRVKGLGTGLGEGEGVVMLRSVLFRSKELGFKLFHQTIIRKRIRGIHQDQGPINPKKWVLLLSTLKFLKKGRHHKHKGQTSEDGLGGGERERGKGGGERSRGTDHKERKKIKFGDCRD